MPVFTQSKTALNVHTAMHFLGVKAGIQEPDRFPVAVHPSLASLPEDSEPRLLYPLDFLPGGGNVLLPWGMVQYWVLGPENGQKVVITHGISSAAVVWQQLATKLASNGFRVLVYDLYGMGYSEAPQVKYEANLFLSQLSMLLQYLRWYDVYLVGSSMGGAISAAFASIFPWIAKDKIVLISCAGLVKGDKKKKQTEKKDPKTAPKPTTIVGQLRALQSKLLPGFEAAVHSCTEHGPVQGLESTFDALGQSDINVLAIHGSNDKRVPLKFAHELKERVPQAELVVLDGAGHDLMSEDRFMHQANDLIVSFLSSPPERPFAQR